MFAPILGQEKSVIDQLNTELLVLGVKDSSQH
jgi:hypothetical protein